MMQKLNTSISYQNVDGHSPVTLTITTVFLPERNMKNADTFEQDVFTLEKSKNGSYNGIGRTTKTGFNLFD
jgi:hypothetical protein